MENDNQNILVYNTAGGKLSKQFQLEQMLIATK